MSELFGQPHYEVIGRYGFHETVISRCKTRSGANQTADDYRDVYPQIIIRFREL